MKAVCTTARKSIEQAKRADEDEKRHIKHRMLLKLADAIREATVEETEIEEMDLVEMSCEAIILQGREMDAIVEFMARMDREYPGSVGISPASPQDRLYNSLGGPMWRDDLIGLETSAFA